jgi:phosphoribosyl-AMP cyclohydrolase
MSSAVPFAPPGGNAALEEGHAFTPRFGPDGLITCVTADAGSGAVLMVAHMNAEALARTLATGEAWYWSRSRGELWRKGATSGQTQTVVELRVDCDQDALLLKVRVGGDGGACHTGRRSCFYRRVALRPAPGEPAALEPDAEG